LRFVQAGKEKGCLGLRRGLVRFHLLSLAFTLRAPIPAGAWFRFKNLMTEETEKAIREFCQQYSGLDTIINQVRNSLALLSTLIKAATDQGKKNSESADRLAASLNRLTGWLVIVAAVALIVQIVSLWHH
jgi:hypothetical protein